MMKIYYRIWVDTLVKIKSQPQNKGRWKILSFVFISMAMALNFISIISILQREVLNNTFYNFELDIFPGSKIDAMLKFFLLFFLPVAIINYSLIFYKKKYVQLMSKYNSSNGLLGISYILLSYFLPLILLVLAYLFQ